jgi:hypothetical protein
MEEKAIKDEMRLYALEVFAANQLSISCLTNPLMPPEQMFETIKRQLIGHLARLHEFGGGIIPPAVSTRLRCPRLYKTDNLTPYTVCSVYKTRWCD